MKKYFLTRLALALPVILLVSVFSFALVFLAPGDPAAQYRTLEMTDEEYEQLKTELGYNDPVIVQYGRWLGNVLHGDFGVSTSSHTGVWPLIKAKLPATVGLMAASIVFSLLVSIPLGMLAGYFENSWFDRITNGLHYVAISIPSFWFAIMLIILFSLNLGWLPSSGMRTTGIHTFWDLARHAIMPVLVLSIGKISIYARYVRAATIQQLSEDYVLFAISKGASRGYILLRHVLKNCLLPEAIRYDVDRVQSSSEDPMGRIFSELDDLERQIAELKAEKAGLISLVAGAIEQLEDDFEKTVLAEFYIGRRSMRDVARAIGYSPRRAYYFRKQGVLHLSTLLEAKSANIAN